MTDDELRREFNEKIAELKKRIEKLEQGEAPKLNG